MLVGIVGLPRSGKTTVFNALTGADAAVGGYGDSQGKPNIGVAKLADPRLDRLRPVFEAKKLVPVEITYVDVPGAREGMPDPPIAGGENLNHLQGTEALMVITRAFEDPSIPHPEDSVDGFRDIETMLFELAAADAGILERRIQRVEEGFKGAGVSEREALTREKDLMERLKSGLEAGVPIRQQPMSEGERPLLAGFQLLTEKPLTVVMNVGEEQLSDVPGLEARLASIDGLEEAATATFCGKLEMELGQMGPDDEAEFRESLGVGGSSRESLASLSYSAMEMVTFFTGNRNEVHGWPVVRDTTALEAAGKIHTDMERGFIRAEVITTDDFMDCGGLAEARKRGLLRQEGRDYVVNDGDVVNVLFSV